MSFEEDLKIFQFASIHTSKTATRAPLMGWFEPNFAQTLIKQLNTFSKSVAVIRPYLVKLWKTVCFERNVQEFVALYFGRFLDYHNCFDTFLSGGFKDNSCKVWCKSAQAVFEKVSFSFAAISWFKISLT